MNKAIENALKIIKRDNPTIFGVREYQSIYMFATENISGVLKSIDVTDKSILTVSSSGDHIFNMLLNGAKSVECYDINYFAKYYFYFKEAAIRTLTYKEFINFFFGRRFNFNKDVFDDKTFFRILPNIRDGDAKLFWSLLFRGCGGKILYNSNLFFQNYYSKNTYIECNDYLKNEANYKVLQQILINYNYRFYWVNIFEDISNIPNKKYDIIYLSNILDRIKNEKELETVQKIKEIVNKLGQYLSKNGVLGICYLYNYLDEYWTVSNPKQICNPDIRFEYFNERENYIYASFSGICNYGSRSYKDQDALMLIKQRKE